MSQNQTPNPEHQQNPVNYQILVLPELPRCCCCGVRNGLLIGFGFLLSLEIVSFAINITKAVTGDMSAIFNVTQAIILICGSIFPLVSVLKVVHNYVKKNCRLLNTK